MTTRNRMETFEEKIWNKIHNKTKPIGSLGRLEELAFQIAKIQNTLEPTLKSPTICVFAGDHGIALEGVSAYPQEVTYQMVLNFLNGGAAINVFCKQHGIYLVVVDAGVKGEFLNIRNHSNFISKKINHGTRNFLLEPSMTSSELEKALNYGKEVVNKEIPHDCNIIGFGEMGIGNTASASLVISNILNIPIEQCTGRGTGLDDDGLKKKIEILKKAQTRFLRHKGSLTSIEPIQVLQEFGGYEIAMMTGAMLQAYEENKILLIDGFIASSAFLVAYKLQPKIINNSIFCHLSKEKGHKVLLDSLSIQPLLNLDMRLGEGTGCAVAYPILQSAVLFFNEMASFEEAGVSQSL